MIQPEQRDDADAAGRHQQLEHEDVVGVPDQHRQGEDGHRPRRVLDVEVAVGDPAVQDERPAVAGVGPDIARVGVAEEAAVADGAGEDEEQRADRRRPVGSPPHRPRWLRRLHSDLP